MAFKDFEFNKVEQDPNYCGGCGERTDGAPGENPMGEGLCPGPHQT